jgi:hypothetical protein
VTCGAATRLAIQSACLRRNATQLALRATVRWLSGKS